MNITVLFVIVGLILALLIRIYFVRATYRIVKYGEPKANATIGLGFVAMYLLLTFAPRDIALRFWPLISIVVLVGAIYFYRKAGRPIINQTKNRANQKYVNAFIASVVIYLLIWFIFVLSGK